MDLLKQEEDQQDIQSEIVEGWIQVQEVVEGSRPPENSRVANEWKR